MWIPIALVWLCVRWRSAESDAEHQRDDNERLRSINTGLRYDLMATRSSLDGAVEAKALLRRQSRARLREARRWRDRAKAAGWTRGSA
jgi:hypothetical protein